MPKSISRGWAGLCRPLDFEKASAVTSQVTLTPTTQPKPHPTLQLQVGMGLGWDWDDWLFNLLSAFNPPLKLGSRLAALHQLPGGSLSRFKKTEISPS